MRVGSQFENQWAHSFFEPMYLAGANKIRLTAGNDIYHAGDSGEHVLGLRGNDSIFGGGGDDILQGGAGNDSLYGDRTRGGRSSDTLYGGDGNDDVEGGAYGDTLFGGDGDDQLLGGNGRDILEGGAGRDYIDLGRAAHGSGTDGKRDIVVCTSVFDTDGDTLSNFRTGEDRIDLSQIDANTTTAEDDSFHFIKSRAFSGTPGELRVDGTMIEADVNGDGQADFQILFPFVDPANDFRAHRDFIL